MANEQNLKPFKKGNKIGKGRPKGSPNLKSVYLTLFSQDIPTKSGVKSGIEALGFAMFIKALKGDCHAYDRVRDEVYGKPVQSIKSEGSLDVTALDLSTMTDDQIKRYLHDARGGSDGSE